MGESSPHVHCTGMDRDNPAKQWLDLPDTDQNIALHTGFQCGLSGSSGFVSSDAKLATFADKGACKTFHEKVQLDTGRSNCQAGGFDGVNWVRPFGEKVPNTESGFFECELGCRARAYTYFGLECPGPDGAFCQCANSLQGSQGVPDVECRVSLETGDQSQCPGPHTTGTYDQFMMGSSLGRGSVYKTGLGHPNDNEFIDGNSSNGFHCAAKPHWLDT